MRPNFPPIFIQRDRMSEPGVWGPSMWRLLHGLAEKLGKHTTMVLIQDEERAWLHFLRSVENVIPCKRCKEHYRNWSLKNRIDGATGRLAARAWLWGLHNEVNTERKVQGTALNEMEAIYGERDITKDTEECFGHLLNAVQRQQIPSEFFRTFKYRLSLLRKFTG
jgi:hypothetical protein